MIDSFSPVAPRLIEIAREKHWKLIHLAKFNGYLPPDLVVQGALVNQIATKPQVQRILSRGIPVVRLASAPHPQDHVLPAVMSDWDEAGRLAAEHFAQRDFRHVATVRHKQWSRGYLLINAFEREARRFGMTCHRFLIDKANLRSRITPKINRMDVIKSDLLAWWRTLPTPIGMLTSTDNMADRYCLWIKQAGLQVPEQFAILGVGNTPVVCDCAMVPLSSIRLDDQGKAEMAMTMLEKQIKGEALEQTTVAIPPVGIESRPSTDVLGATDPDVAQALRYMWEHISENVSVDMIAEHTDISRRTLERRFHEHFGRGIGQEFQRRRLEEACDLLLHTTLSVAEIVSVLRYSSNRQFFRA